MCRETPIDYHIVTSKINELGICDLGQAKIREIVKVVNEIEAVTGDEFIRMEMGVPGLEPASVGTEAEIRALKNGVASQYANMEGVAELKQEILSWLDQRYVQDQSDKETGPLDPQLS